MEQDDRVLLFPAIVTQRDYTIYSLNQGAPRTYRREIFNSLKKVFADHFEGRDAHKDQEMFNRRSDELYEKIEKRFIEENFDEEKMPILDFEIDINYKD